MNDKNKNKYLVTTLDNHTKDILSLFVDRNRLYSGSKDWSVRVWNKTNWKCIASLHHGARVNKVLADKNFIYTGSSDTNLKIWDKKNNKNAHILNQPIFSVVNDICTDKENCYVALNNRNVKIYSKKTWEEEKKLQHPGIVRFIECDKQFLYSALSNGSLIIWEKNGWKLVKRLDHSLFRSIEQMQLHKNYLYTVIKKTIKVWDLKKKKQKARIKCKKPILSLKVYDSLIIAGCKDKKIRFWDTNNFKEKNKQITTQSRIISLETDGEFILAGSKDGKIYVLDYPIYKGKKRKTTKISLNTDEQAKVRSEEKEKKKSSDFLVKELREIMKPMSYEERVEFTKGDTRKTVIKMVEQAKESK